MLDTIKNRLDLNDGRRAYIFKRKVGSFVFKLFRFLFIFGLCYLFLFPLLYIVTTAFQDPAAANDPTVVYIPKALSLVGLKGAWTSLKFSDSALLTLIITVFGTAASIVSCAMVGYGFARFNFPLKNVAFVLVLLTIIVPVQIIVSANYLNYWFFDFGGILKMFGITLNLLNSPWVFVLPAIFATGLRNGLFIFIFRQFFAGQPKDLEEAARIDGCGPFKTFARIMVPLATPAFVTVLLFSIVWHWNEYYSSAIYFTTAIKPISCMLSNLRDAITMGGLASGYSSTYQVRSFLMAGTLLSILPPLVLYIFTQRFFTESIERTGLVG